MLIEYVLYIHIDQPVHFFFAEDSRNVRPVGASAGPPGPVADWLDATRGFSAEPWEKNGSWHRKLPSCLEKS